MFEMNFVVFLGVNTVAFNNFDKDKTAITFILEL